MKLENDAVNRWIVHGCALVLLLVILALSVPD